MNVLLKNCRILDVNSGLVKEADVDVKSGDIQTIDKNITAEKDQGLIDLQGMYLLPGLISCHTHLTIVFPF